MLALAALTNVALALHLDPQLPEKLVGPVGFPVLLDCCRSCDAAPLSSACTLLPSLSSALGTALPPPHCQPALPCTLPACCPLQSRLVVLGGAFNCNGNVNPAAEANIYGDPDAANVVFSRWGQAG